MMPSSTYNPLLFSSATIRSPASSLSPGARHKCTLDLPLPHAVGEHQPLEGIRDPHSYRTPKALQTHSGESSQHRKLVATWRASANSLSSSPSLGSSAEPSQHSCLGWPTSSLPRADQAASSPVGNNPCCWVMPDIRPHELSSHCYCNALELAHLGHPPLPGILPPACYSQASSIPTLYDHTEEQQGSDRRKPGFIRTEGAPHPFSNQHHQMQCISKTQPCFSCSHPHLSPITQPSHVTRSKCVARLHGRYGFLTSNEAQKMKLWKCPVYSF